MNKKLILIVLLLLIITTGLGLYFYFFKNEKIKNVNMQQDVDKFNIFITQSSKNFITKTIYIKKELNEIKKIDIIMEQFLRENSSSLKDAKILGIYRDKEGIVYLDLSEDHYYQMDAMHEYLLLKCLFKTLKQNFPWISDIKILVNGKQIESLSGHFLIENFIEEKEEETNE